MDEYHLFENEISHFIVFVQAHGGNLSTTNHYLLVLDSHNSHITINVMHKEKHMGLNFIKFSSHKSCFATFNVTCFKTFKIHS